MVNYCISGNLRFVYSTLARCCPAFSGTAAGSLKLNSFFKKSIIFYIYSAINQDSVALKMRDVCCLNVSLSASLITFNRKNLKLYGTGCN
jgi:hypothetical protein